MLLTADLDFKYPNELVATVARPRGESRILKIPRDNSDFEELTWSRFLAHFQKGDTLVLNDSRVLWARLVVPKATGAKGEIFFLKAVGNIWEVLAKGLNMKEGKVLDLPGDIKAKVVKSERISFIEIQNAPKNPNFLKDYFEKWGHVPLPPYIGAQRNAEKKSDANQEAEDKARYQNVWAKKWGSVAAPTAGLHFSENHLEDLKKAGIKIAVVTLHVGAGTFLPIQTKNLNDFKIHSEVASVPKETCEAILKTQAAGKKVWACGTTALRALETAVHASSTANTRLSLIEPFLGETTLFVTPGYRFRVVDGLLTNFHQPQSSLLALAAAFATRDPAQTDAEAAGAVKKILSAYDYAIKKKFRLFSYGDLTVIS